MMLLAPLLPFLRIPHNHPQWGPQCHPTYTGGARPKVSTQPSTGWCQALPWPRLKEELDPINHPNSWIHVKMENTIHPHWWKELKASGRVSMDSHMVREGLSNSEGLQEACWQVAVCGLPLAQLEALGWWDAPSWFSRLCPSDFMFHTNSSIPRDFWAVRQEKTIALAWVLQVCTKELGVPTGVLC